MNAPITILRPNTLRSPSMLMQERRREYLRLERPCGCTDSDVLVAALRAVLRSPDDVEVNREARLLLQNIDDTARFGGR